MTPVASFHLTVVSEKFYLSDWLENFTADVIDSRAGDTPKPFVVYKSVI